MIYDNEENAIVNTQPQVSETPANLVGKGDANEKQLSPNPANFGFVKQVIVDTLPVSNQEVDTLYLLKVKNNGEVVGYKKYRWTENNGYALLSGATPDLIVKDGVREQKAVEVNAPRKAFAKVYNGDVGIIGGKLYIDGKEVVGGINPVGFTVEVVEELPDTGENGVLYLVPLEDGETSDIYEEYVWVDSTSTFEKVGSTAIKLPLTADNISSGLATSGQVLTADGSGNTSWESVSSTTFVDWS